MSVFESVREIERARRRVKNRRYGHRHRLVRAELAPLVEAGLARCARCGNPIEPGSRWQLGHDDFDRSRYHGPEHAVCNENAPRACKVSRVW